MQRMRWKAALAALLCTVASASAAPAPRFYRLQWQASLPGPVQGWDYLAFDAARGFLFVDRRAQGVTVFDVRRRKIVGQVARSEGADASVLVPRLNRGFTANRDGSTTIFALDSLRTLKRVRFGKSADSGFYEPVTAQMVFTMGDAHALAFLDARSGKPTGTLSMDSGELEAAAPDGRGNLFVNERDRDRIARVDMRARRVTALWPTGPCHEPTAMAYDAEDERLFSGCRGDRPVLAVLDARSGGLVAAPTIGRGTDSVIYDRARRLIYTSNGIDGNLVVLRQQDANRYALHEAITTQPLARTMAFDPATGQLFLVTAQGGIDPAKPINTAVAPFYPNTYFADSLRVLAYAPDRRHRLHSQPMHPPGRNN